MKNKLHILLMLLALIGIIGMESCSDDDSFSLSTSNLLSFEVDTLSLDTVFSTVPSPHKQFKVHNNSGDGIRIVNARLEKGNQTGFRVNVNGSYLGQTEGYQIRDVEMRKGDSLRVFVELTSVRNNCNTPQLVDDNLLFTLESGVVQKVNLNAWSWDAIMMRNSLITNDSTISNVDGKPIVVYGELTVDTFATVTIAPGTTMYFHNDAGIHVNGKLIAKGTAENEITLRCDRLDRMVSNLMYDNNPGQWGGIYYAPCSYDNELEYVDMHAGTTAVKCDSSLDDTRHKLSISHSTLHNMKGYAVDSKSANITIQNSQLSNSLEGCLNVIGGNVKVDYSTIVQYYPFDAKRGPAIFLANAEGEVSYPLSMKVSNSIVKGYEDDVIYWSRGALENKLDVRFNNCLVRSPLPQDEDAELFENCIHEDVADTLTNGRNSFELFDTHFFFYGFMPKEATAPIGKGVADPAIIDDRKGNPRNPETPTLGCFEWIKKEEKTEEE